nr:MAG TPA: hypothetical protein [Caudoviricetes sp.]
MTFKFVTHSITSFSHNNNKFYFYNKYIIIYALS